TIDNMIGGIVLGKGIFPLTFNYDKESLLDGLELLCQVGVVKDDSDCDVTSLPPIGSVADLSKAEHYLQCMADSIQGLGARVVLADFPEQAKDPLRKHGGVGAFPATGGLLGLNIEDLRLALVDLAMVPDLMAAQMRLLSSNMQAV